MALGSTENRVQSARRSPSLFWSPEVLFANFRTSSVRVRAARYCGYKLQTYLEEGGGGDFLHTTGSCERLRRRTSAVCSQQCYSL